MSVAGYAPIEGKVTESSGTPLPGATIIFTKQDGTLIKGFDTRNDGSFFISDSQVNAAKKDEPIAVEISHVGYNPKKFLVNSPDLGVIVLSRKDNILDEVIVTFKKPTQSETGSLFIKAAIISAILLISKRFIP